MLLVTLGKHMNFSRDLLAMWLYLLLQKSLFANSFSHQYLTTLNMLKSASFTGLLMSQLIYINCTKHFNILLTVHLLPNVWVKVLQFKRSNK